MSPHVASEISINNIARHCVDCKKTDVELKYLKIKGEPLLICWKCFKIREVENRFTFHPMSNVEAELYLQNRAAAKQLALRLIDVCPSSEELDEALYKLDEVVYWANAAIARGDWLK